MSTRQTWFGAVVGCAALASQANCGQLIGLGDGYYEIPLASSAAGGGAASGGASAIPPSGSAGLPETAGSGGELTTDAGAGTGGVAHVPACDLPITAKKDWVASSSPVSPMDPPAELIDGSAKRWSTGRAQQGGEWFQIDFGAPISIRRVNLQQGGGNTNDYPRAYRVVVSDIAQNLMGEAALVGVGDSGVTTTIVLPRITNGRYLLIEQTDYVGSTSWWSVDEAEFSCY